MRSIMKESNDRGQTKEYETKLEQIINAVKEGFRSQNDFLANTIKGTNQVEQKTPVSQTQHTILHQAQQTPNMQNTQVNQAQLAIMHQIQQSHMMYAQNFPQIPQFIQPANSFQMNHPSLFNVQQDEYASNAIRQKLPSLTNM